jgi:colanic acid/amylovoran biosynthesis protein
MFRLNLDYGLLVNKLLERFMEDTEAEILLIPHTFGPQGNINSDPDACRAVFNSFKEKYNSRIHLVNLKYNQNEIKGIIGLSNFFIGSRMHSCIAAISQGIPTIGIAYSNKFMGVFNSVDLGSMVIDARVIDMPSAIQNILMLFKHRLENKNVFDNKIENVQKMIRYTFQKLLSV